METGYLVGSIACIIFGLFCIGIGAFKPDGTRTLGRLKLKLFTRSKKSVDSADAVFGIVLGTVALIAGAALFIAGVANV